MIEIPLRAIPNQAFSIQLDNNFYDIVLKETNGMMAATISRNNEIVIQGARIVAGTPLIPFRYLEDGNFIFLTEDGDIPYYTEFEDTQSLIYASAAELEVIRGT